MAVVFFIYGLAFFVLGLALVIYPKKHSKFWLAQNVWLIATFAILHGLHEWLDMFIIIQEPPEIFSLLIIKSFLLPVSFFFLLWFGTKSIIEVKNRHPALRTVPILVLIIWLIVVLSSKERILMSDIWARYLLGVPGILLTSYALMAQSIEIKQFGSPATIYLKLAALFFLLYCFFSGLIVPDAGFFPASFLNYTVFTETVGLEVQVFRTLSALGITFGMIKVLGIFELETIEAVRKSRDELEMKVKKRTEDLIETNQDLEMEIAGRKEREKHILDMVSIATHDIRGPLISIGSIIKLLIRGAFGSIDESVKVTLLDISARVSHLEKLVSEYLCKSSIMNVEMPEKEYLDMRQDIIDPILDEFLSEIDENKISIDNRLGAIPGNEVIIKAKAQWIRIVYRNLIRNAIKYSPSGQIAFGFEDKGDHYRLNVYNSGPPVPEEKWAEIFEKFESKDSTGLGLAISRDLIRKHGGDMWYENTWDNHPNFIFTIPK